MSLDLTGQNRTRPGFRVWVRPLSGEAQIWADSHDLIINWVRLGPDLLTQVDQIKPFYISHNI